MMKTEQLFVKNFGPVTASEICIKKINIIIGPASSGKSTIAKLISIFKSEKLYASPDQLDTFKKMLFEYNIAYGIGTNTIIRYDNDDLYVEIKDQEFNTNFASLKMSMSNNSIYIPTERIFFPTFSESIFNFLTSGMNLPKWLIEFGAQFEQARTALKRFKIDFLNVHYVFSNGNDLVELANGQVIKLSQTSSGIQSVLPLMLVVQHNSTKNGNNSIVIEEPELSLFPRVQSRLLEFIFDCINKFDSKLIITTHSPYIINSLTLCIKAFSVLNQVDSTSQAEVLRNQVNHIVPIKSAVDPVKCIVYEMKDDGSIKVLETYEGIPSDENYLNEALAEGNELFAGLLEIEDLCQ